MQSRNRIFEIFKKICLYCTKDQLTRAFFSNTIVLKLEKMEEKSCVFIVDDDPSVRKALARFIGSVGYNVEAYATAQEFLDSVPAVAEGCLILDLRMPGMNGLRQPSRQQTGNGCGCSRFLKKAFQRSSPS
jgi:PleD family two-component response regulator